MGGVCPGAVSSCAPALCLSGWVPAMGLGAEQCIWQHCVPCSDGIAWPQGFI